MNVARAALLLAWLSLPAAAADAPSATMAPESDPTILSLMDKMKSDPAITDLIVRRVMKSELAGRITTETEDEPKEAAIRKWLENDRASAARVGLGLMHDDNVGKPEYEQNLLHQMDVTYEENPGAKKNIFNRLVRNAKESRLVRKQSEEMSADEQSEILRKLFEGLGGGGKVISGKGEENGKVPDAKAAPATSFNGIYDRLGAGNLRGYSPQLMGLQSSLNTHRPPGAPPLIETGKLDYATLSYPAYAMKYDVGNLDTKLRADRIMALAALAGHKLTAQDWKDKDIEAMLASQVPPGKLSPRLAKAAELAAKARAALEAFQDAAEKAKNPAHISRGLLMELGAKQKETARWITAAAIDEELARLEPLEGFLTPELLAAIDAVPAPQPQRAAYKRRGEELKAKVAQVKANAEKALGILESDAWASSLGDVDKLTSANRDLKANLGRDVEDYARVPYRAADARVVQPRWREMLDDAAVKWAPTLSYSRGVAQRRGRLTRLLSVFSMIAAGDANGAHAALIND
jgi:hypothetical protein